MTMLKRLKNIDPDDLDNYLNDLFTLTHEEGIELTHYHVKKQIERIPADKTSKERWLKLNNRYRDAFLSPERIHLFKTCTGSGKTVTSIMWVKMLTKISRRVEGFVVLSAEYEHGTDEVERIILKHGNRTEYIKFEGKNRLCSQLNTKVNNSVTVGSLMKNNIGISNYCSEECPERDYCVYMGNCRRIIEPFEDGGIKNWIGVQHQISNFLPIYLSHVGKIFLIIDEDFSDAIKVSKKFKIKDMRENVAFLYDLLRFLNNKGKNNENDETYALAEQLIKLLTEFIDGLYDFKKPHLNYDKIEHILQYISIIKGNNNYYFNSLNDHAFEMITSRKIKPFKFILNEISNFIDNLDFETNYEIENDSITHLDDWLKASFFKKKTDYTISFLYYDKSTIEKLLGKQNIDKIIINDATSNKVILEYLIGKKEIIIEHDESWLYEKCEFHQLKKPINSNNRDGKKYAHYPKSSLLHKSTFFHLYENVKAISDKHKNEKILVVSREISGESLNFNGNLKLSDFLCSALKNVVFADYPLSGTNAFSNINVIVLLGKPDLPKSVINRQSNLIGDISSEEYREIYSKNNMLQAIGRIMRGGNHKSVYILSGFDLGLNVKIKTYNSHSDFQKQVRSQIKIIKKENLLFNYLKENNGEVTINKLMKISGKSRYLCEKELKNLVVKHILGVKLKSSGKDNRKMIFYKLNK